MIAEQTSGSIVQQDLIPVDEFREEGYLQEVNRTFFHPHGLALSVRRGWTREDVERILDLVGHETEVEEEVDACMALLRGLGLDAPHFVGVHDGRDDLEGVFFHLAGADVGDRDRALRIEYLRNERMGPRREALGFFVQPVGGVLTTADRIKAALDEIEPLDLDGDLSDLADAIAADLGQ